MEILVDPVDSWLLAAFHWHRHTVGRMHYARGKISRHRKVYLHRIIVRADEHLVVDHINGNGFDNRRSNLRVCTRAQNNRHQLRVRGDNHSGFTGVYRSSTASVRWYAQIKVNGRAISLGSFGSFQEAMAARMAAEQRYFGEFAPSRGPA